MRLVIACFMVVVMLREASAFSLLLGPLKSAIKNARMHQKSIHMNAEKHSRNFFGGVGTVSLEKVASVGPSGQIQLKTVPKSAFLCRTTSWILNKVIQSRTHHSRGMEITVLADSNSNVVKGQFRTIALKFRELQSEHLNISGGGKVTISDLHVDLKRLLFQRLQFVRKPYNVHLDVHMTKEDIASSKFIKNFVQTMCNCALERAFGSSDAMSINISTISILGSRLVVRGAASGLADSSSPTSWNLRGTTPTETAPDELSLTDFEMSTALAVRAGSSRVLLLQDLSVVLSPDHTFPTPVPVPSVEVDLGEYCHIEKLLLSDNSMHFTGSTMISPHAPSVVLSEPMPIFTQADWVASLNPLSLLWNSWTTTLYHSYDISALLSSSICLNGGIFSTWLKKKLHIR